MKLSKIVSMIAAPIVLLSACSQKNQTEMNLTTEWDKVFPKSEKVNHEKVTFVNKFGITLVADVYKPINASEKLAAIAVSGPFGATKEQSSGLYAQNMAEQGFLAIAFDPSFTGESGGQPRRIASPDINTEDFQAAVDYLISRSDVDAEKVGIIGICGWGGIALNAAAIDPRIKATVASTMYDMSRVGGNGYFDSEDNEAARYAGRVAMAKQRNEDFARVLTQGQATNDNAEGAYTRAGGVVDPLPADAPQFVKDYFDYYKTSRGYHKRSGNSNDGWNVTGTQSYSNTRFLYYINEIRSAVLVMHGEKAHSRYFGESAYHYMVDGKAEGYNTVGKPNPCPENKELLIIPNASHCDLYDGGKENYIPWDTLVEFFNKNLK